MDAHPDQRENPDMGIEQFPVFQPDLILVFQQLIEFRYEIGKQLQEDLVKIPQQLFPLFFQIQVIYKKADLIQLTVCDFIFDRAFKFLDPGIELRVAVKKISDILLLDLIGFFEFCVYPPLLFVRQGNGFLASFSLFNLTDDDNRQQDQHQKRDGNGDRISRDILFLSFNLTQFLPFD